MLIISEQEISQADYNEISGDTAKIEEYVGWRARFSGYPPAGYGFFKPVLFEKDKQFFCAWSHRDNCD